MNKNLFNLLLGMFLLIGIVSAGSISVTLNNPTDSSIVYINPVNFDSTSTTDATSIQNISLWTNETGTWALRNTTSGLNPKSTNDNNVSMASFSNSADAIGVKIIPSRDINISQIKKYTGSGGTRVRIYDENGTLMATTTDLNSYTFTIAGGVVLSSGRLYAIMVDGGVGNPAFDKWFGSETTPITDADLSWRFGSGEASYPFSNISNNLYGIEQVIVSDVPSDTFTENISRTFTPGSSILWNIEACDNEGSCGFAAANYSFFLDNDGPTFNLNYPTEIINFSYAGNYLQINFTATDTNLDDCWIEYEGVNNSVSCTSGTPALYNLTLTETKTAKIWGNDTLGNENYSAISWDYKIFQNDLDYNNLTTETFTEEFILNITLGSGVSLSSAYLNYNGTNYATSINSSGDMRILIRSINIPYVTSEENISFFFVLNTNQGQINSSAFNQTIRSLDIDDCSVNTHLILSYTIYDEDNRSKLNASYWNTTANVFVRLSGDLSGTEYQYFSGEITTNSITICVNEELITGQTYRLDSEVQYTADEYVTEYHYIDNHLLNTSSPNQQVSLYLLKVLRSQEFLITFKDTNLIPVEGAYIELTRQYLDIADFLSVEISKTDNDGRTIGHFVLNDEVYTIYVKKDGELLATFENVRAFCSDIVTGDCRINLNQQSTTSNPSSFSEYLGITGSEDYDDENRIYSFSFTSLDSTTKTINVTLIKFDSYLNDTLCSEELVSSSGTITCNIPSSYENNTALVKIYVDGELYNSHTFDIAGSRDTELNAMRYFLAFLLIITIPLLAITSGPMTLLFFVLGLVFAGGLAAIDWGGFIGPFSAFLWLVIAAIILIVKAAKRRQQF